MFAFPCSGRQEIVTISADATVFINVWQCLITLFPEIKALENHVKSSPTKTYAVKLPILGKRFYAAVNAFLPEDFSAAQNGHSTQVR
ncbi:hypothetical protein DN30_3296 [Vibrio cholerae]|nr:hypothetical protein DN30_3296 [Vibrio cholerae]